MPLLPLFLSTSFSGKQKDSIVLPLLLIICVFFFPMGNSVSISLCFFKKCYGPLTKCTDHKALDLSDDFISLTCCFKVPDQYLFLQIDGSRGRRGQEQDQPTKGFRVWPLHKTAKWCHIKPSKCLAWRGKDQWKLWGRNADFVASLADDNKTGCKHSPSWPWKNKQKTNQKTPNYCYLYYQCDILTLNFT